MKSLQEIAGSNWTESDHKTAVMTSQRDNVSLGEEEVVLRTKHLINMIVSKLVVPIYPGPALEL